MDKTKFYTNRRNIVLLATLCCILWGSAYPSIKIGYSLFNIDDIGSKLVFAGYRFALAGILVLLLEVITTKNIFNFSKKQFGQITLLGLTQTALQYIFFYIGLSYTTGVRGSIINGTGTFVSIILAHFIYKNDKLNFNKIMGCIIGFLGVVIVNLNGQSLEGSSFTFKGEGFVMIAAIIFAASAIYGKKITQIQEAIDSYWFSIIYRWSNINNSRMDFRWKFKRIHTSIYITFNLHGIIIFSSICYMDAVIKI